MTASGLGGGWVADCRVVTEVGTQVQVLAAAMIVISRNGARNEWKRCPSRYPLRRNSVHCLPRAVQYLVGRPGLDKIALTRRVTQLMPSEKAPVLTCCA